MDLRDVIIRPIITEKSTDQVGQENKYSFQVVRGAPKSQIKEAVEKFYGVKVRKVNTAIVRGKTRRTLRLRKETRKADWEKAIVQLADGQKIDIFPEKEK